MAKKTDNKLDNDFNFDAEFGGDFDFDLPDPTVKDDRKPSVKIASGLKMGAKETLMSRDFAISSAKKLFPTGYGQAYDEADRIGQSFKNLYDESAQAIKPAIKQAKQIASRLIPADSKYLPAGLAKVFKGWEQDAKNESGSPGNVEGNNREALLSASLKDLFKAEATESNRARVQDKAETDLQRGVESIRHRSVLETLNRTALATTSLDNYNKRINVNYQKQSLTLQYRQLFALEDMRADLARDALKRDSILLAISKNTGLPEYAKIRDSEARKQAIKNKFYDSVANGLYGGRNQYIEKTLSGVKKNVGTAIKNGAQGFMTGLTQLSMMVDMADGSGMDGAVLGGQIAGGAGAEALGHAIAAKLGRKLAGSKLDKRWGISAKGHKLAAGVDNLPNFLNEFRKSGKYAWGNSLKDKGLSMLQSLLPGMAPDTQTDIGRGGDMNSPYHFTRRTDRSINEVIPGFLSRILREVQILRTGNAKIPLVEYDHDTNGFARGDTVTKGIFAKAIPAGAVQATHMRLDGILSMIDPQNALSPEVRGAIKKRLLFNSADNNMASRDRLANESAYAGHSPAVAKAAADHMTDYFNWAGEEKLKHFQGAHNQLARDIADPRQHIQQQIDLGHLQRLSRMGLVNSRTGQIDLAKILTQYLDPRNGQVRAEPMGPAGLTENLNDGPQGAFVGPRKGTIRQARDSIKQIYADRQELTRRGKRQAKRATIKGRRLARDTGVFVKAAALEAASEIHDDLYAATEDHPRLRAVLVESEQYVQKSTGKIVKTFNDLTDDIVDRTTGKLIVSKQELSQMGVLDEASGKLKPISEISGAVVKAVKSAKIGKETFSKDGVKGLAKGMLATFKDELIGDADVPTGAKVEGEEDERISMGEMKEGSCVDVETGLPILKPSDITGVVKNKLGQIVVRMEDLPKLRFFNVRVGKYTPLWFASRLLTKALKWQFIGAPKMAARNLRRLGKFAFGAATSVLKAGLWLAGIRPGTTAEDLYLPGQKDPILIGKIMAAGGYYAVGFGGRILKAVMRPADIMGELRDANGQVVLTNEQFQQGLYTIRGRKVSKSFLGRLIKGALKLPFQVAGKLISLPAKAAWGATKLAGRAGLAMTGGLLRGMGSAAGGLARGAGWLAGIRYEGNEAERQALYEQRKLSSGARVDLPGTVNNAVAQVKERADGLRQDINGRWRNLKGHFVKPPADAVDKKMPGATLDKLESKDAGKFADIQRKTGMSREEAERVHQLKDMDVLAAEAKEEMAERHNKRKRLGGYDPDAIKERLKGLASKDGIKGLVGQVKDKAKAAGAGWGLKDLVEGAGDAKDAAKGAWKGAKAAGGWAKRLLGFGKTAAGLATGAEVLGGAAAAAEGTGLAAGAALGAEGVAAGTAAAVGGGSLLATLGAGAAIAAPVVIGALALGLLGYGIYRGVKYLRKGHLSEIGQLRCVQYGFAADDTMHARAVVDFEALMTPLVKIAAGQPFIDEQKIPLKDCLKVFDLDHTNPLQVNSFVAWYKNRFKPVFLTHQAALRGLSTKTDLAAADDLKPEEQKKYLDAVAFGNGPYGVVILPVTDLEKSHATGAEDVKKALNLAYAAMGKPSAVAKAATAVAGAVTGSTAAKAAEAPKPAQTVKQQADLVKTTPADRQTLGGTADAESPVKNQTGAAVLTQAAGAAGLVLASGDMSEGRNANAFVRLGRNVKLEGMNPQMKTQLMGLIEEYGTLTGKATTINDGFRSYDDQLALYRANPTKAAKPGSSMHEYGLAVDINQGTLNEMDKLGLLRKYGFVRPVGQEPWHLEPIGTQTNLDAFKQDQAAAAQAILAGAGKGGGGWGTMREASANSRNLKLAQSILDASVTETDPKQAAGGTMAGSFTAPVNQPLLSFGARTKVGSTDAPGATATIKTAAWHAQTTQNAVIGAARTALASANDAEYVVKKSSAPMGPMTGQGDPTAQVPDPTGSGLAGVKDTILGAAKLVGVDGNLMLQTVAVESDFKVSAAPDNTSAQGLFQDTKATWADLIAKYGKKYGYTLQNTSPMDVKAAAILNAHFLKDNLEALGKQSNRPLNAADAYAMHLFGRTGGPKFLDALAQSPNANAAQLFPAAAQSNPNLFYKQGQALSVADVYANLTEVIRKKSQAYGLSNGQIQVAGGSTAAPTSGGALIGVQPSDMPAALSTRGRPSLRAPAGIGASAPLMQPPGSYLPPAYSAAPQPQPQHRLDSQALSKSEDLLGKQLQVQLDIKDVLMEIKDMIGNKDGSNAAPPAPAPQVYTPPQGRVSMERHRYG